MATIQINLVDAGTGAPLAPFFYNLEDGDSYEVKSYSANSDELSLFIQVKDGSGNAKEYLTINRYDGSINGSSMPQCLKAGVEASVDTPYRLDGPTDTAVWDKSSGAAWDKAVNDATANGGEPGLFQEAIWYFTESDQEAFAEAQASYKQQESATFKEIEEAKVNAEENGFTTFRTPGAGILSIDDLDVGAVARAIVGPYKNLPFLGKVGVVYQSVTVTNGSVPG